VATGQDLHTFAVSSARRAAYPRDPTCPFCSLDSTRVTADEWAAVRVALDRARARIDAEHHPEGYNVGVNVGEAAGQTVQHLHVHLVPRRAPRASQRRAASGRAARVGAHGGGDERLERRSAARAGYAAATFATW
jgi:diadenosine tetraphosphate (Ap4A) HIT family hydrolase